MKNEWKPVTIDFDDYDQWHSENLPEHDFMFFENLPFEMLEGHDEGDKICVRQWCPVIAMIPRKYVHPAHVKPIIVSPMFRNDND